MTSTPVIMKTVILYEKVTTMEHTTIMKTYQLNINYFLVLTDTEAQQQVQVDVDGISDSGNKDGQIFTVDRGIILYYSIGMNMISQSINVSNQPTEEGPTMSP